MQRYITSFFFQVVLAATLISQPVVTDQVQFRPPSVPLITHDPYFSIWSPSDRLTDMETVHWTGTRNPIHSLIRIDGKVYRLIGANPSPVEPMKQLSLKITPTGTAFEFGNQNIKVSLNFTSPLLVRDIDILSRPVTYITWNIIAADNKTHQVQVYFDCGPELCVNNTDQNITWKMKEVDDLKAASIGSQEQKPLNKSGDNLRIDWGYVWLAVPKTQNPVLSTAQRNNLFKSFISTGKLPESDLYSDPKKAKDGFVSAATVWDLGKTGSTSSTIWAIVAYDDIYSIRYFENDLQAWWKHTGISFEKMLTVAASDYPKLMISCRAFDKEIMTDLEKAGGEKYAQICALVYRQCLAAHKLVVDKKGNPLLFPKENFSNGCISTVDVIYPFSPFVLLFSPVLTKAMLQPVLEYASSERWKFPFAPHDLGTYPYATGQVYGGSEKDETNQMPVEETGNMLIMLASLAKVEGNAGYAKQYWPLLEKWADYLLSKGFDPENQLCTDDFAGHLAHNVNLSAKAIIAIRSYAMLCEMNGFKDKAAAASEKAKNMAKDWVRLATEGNHTLLAYDQKSTWSQKYNLVWDKLLDFNLFPKEVLKNEINYYKTVMGPYGLPLDNRERYTKNDWITWTATLADNLSDFRAIFDPVYDFANKTPDRVPFSDWYIVDNARQVGFQARSVVGGLFIKMLDNKDIWKKWSGK